MREESFYIISSLSRDESWVQLSRRKKYKSEKEAIEYARELVKTRSANCQAPLSFFVLKAVSVVGHITPPVSVRKLK